jgi:hypothetical protein
MQTGRIEMANLRFGFMAALGLWYAAGVGLGCSSNNNGQAPSGGTIHSTTGGGAGNAAAGSAGSSAAASAGNGAAGASTSPSTGGSTQNGTAGSSAAAGSAAGGTSAAGGSATGGASAAGGSATGGASAAGGSAAGGTSAAGGSVVGGTSAAGGSATGGASVAGGSAAGGATKTGGATSGGAGASGSATGGSAAGGSSGGSQGGTTSTSASSGGSTGTGACAPRVLSLSANATGGATDTAYAHVEVDMKTDLPIGNAARTVEFWAYIKTTDWVGEKNEVYYIGPAANATSASTFGLDFGTNNVTGSTTNHATLNPFTNGLNDDTGADLGINSSTAQWVHVAMTWDQKALVTYVNGVAKITDNATTAVPVLNTAQSILYIGCNPTNKNCFNGEFAEFRVWNVARSAAEILANYKKPMVGNETGLVGYWKFDDAANATTAADSVTTTGHTAHPGTLKATTTAQNPTFVAPSPAVPITCP